jgi:hypothetical protein
MIIKPLRAQKPRPVALLVPGWRSIDVYSEDGVKSARGPQRCWNLLKTYEHHVCYVASNLKGLTDVTGATHWRAELWKGRAVAMTLDGTTLKVLSLRRTLNGCNTPAAQYEALTAVTNWLADQGVKMGSLSAMAWNLWRSTLAVPLELGFNPAVGRAAFFGGRKGASRPYNYHDQVSVDISKAYPHAMTSRPYAASLREVDKATTLDPEVAGIARVRVYVPEELAFPTLPIRLGPDVIQWRAGLVEGTYPWGEVVAAASLGCRVEILRSWAPVDEVQPFTAWWSTVQLGFAAVGDDAAKLVKALGNLVWASFAMNADQTGAVRWEDDYGDHPFQVEHAPRQSAQLNTVHIAAETSSRVRTRMLLEGLYGDSEPPIHVDTDGLICSRASYIRRETGNAVGEWRAKTFMVDVEMKAPQMYRYRCSHCPHTLANNSAQHSGDPNWHYVAAGTPGRFASHLFETHPGFQVSFHDEDVVVGVSGVLDDLQVRRYLEAADELNTTAYGPKLA